jgi:hypothetical protein
MSPRAIARLGGLFYVGIIVTAPFAQLFVRSSLIEPGDTAATARNILASEQLYRAAAAADFGTLVCDVSLALILV